MSCFNWVNCLNLVCAAVHSSIAWFFRFCFHGWAVHSCISSRLHFGCSDWDIGRLDFLISVWIVCPWCDWHDVLMPLLHFGAFALSFSGANSDVCGGSILAGCVSLSLSRRAMLETDRLALLLRVLSLVVDTVEPAIFAVSIDNADNRSIAFSRPQLICLLMRQWGWKLPLFSIDDIQNALTEFFRSIQFDWITTWLAMQENNSITFCVLDFTCFFDAMRTILSPFLLIDDAWWPIRMKWYCAIELLEF